MTNKLSSQLAFLSSYSHIMGVWKEGVASFLSILALTYLATGFFGLDATYLHILLQTEAYLITLLLVTVKNVWTDMQYRKRSNIVDADISWSKNLMYSAQLFVPLLAEFLFWRVGALFVPHIIMIALLTYIMELTSTKMLLYLALKAKA